MSKITFGLGQTNIVFQTTVCKAERKADILTFGLKIKHSLELAPAPPYIVKE